MSLTLSELRARPLPQNASSIVPDGVIIRLTDLENATNLLASLIPAAPALGETFNAQSQSSAATIDFTVALVHQLTMTGATVTITLAGAIASVACGLTIYLVQDGTGGRLITWPGSVKWPGGVTPILSTAIDAVDVVVMESVDGGTTWFANLAGRGYT